MSAFRLPYYEDRTHLGLDKDTPSERLIEGKPEGAELESLARVGGLRHRYVWKAAAWTCGEIHGARRKIDHYRCVPRPRGERHTAFALLRDQPKQRGKRYL